MTSILFSGVVICWLGLTWIALFACWLPIWSVEPVVAFLPYFFTGWLGIVSKLRSPTIAEKNDKQVVKASDETTPETW